jgi:hypothetical protein
VRFNSFAFSCDTTRVSCRASVHNILQGWHIFSSGKLEHGNPSPRVQLEHGWIRALASAPRLSNLHLMDFVYQLSLQNVAYLFSRQQPKTKPYHLPSRRTETCDARDTSTRADYSMDDRCRKSVVMQGLLVDALSNGPTRAWRGDWKKMKEVMSNGHVKQPAAF